MSKTSMLILTTVLILASGTLIAIKQPTTAPDATPSTNPTPSTTANPIITANFEIYTNSTKRIFTDSRYHEQSSEVYIEASSPSIVHVTQANITWANFFDTLPMKLTRDCLTTGTGQLFCTSDTGRLKFFLNSKEEPNALNRAINQGDHLVVEYVPN